MAALSARADCAWPCYLDSHQTTGLPRQATWQVVAAPARCGCTLSSLSAGTQLCTSRHIVTVVLAASQNRGCVASPRWQVLRLPPARLPAAGAFTQHSATWGKQTAVSTCLSSAQLG